MVYRYYRWDGLDGYGRRAVCATENGVELLGAFQPLLNGRWIQQATDVLHECSPVKVEQVLADHPDIDLAEPVSDYRPGYKPGSAERNGQAGLVYDILEQATYERRELTLDEMRVEAAVTAELRAAYGEAWERSMGRRP